VARVDDIQATVAATPGAFGEVLPMSRGPLTWFIALPASDPCGPALIQWVSGPHPASSLPDSGCTLIRLTGTQPVLPAPAMEFDPRLAHVSGEPPGLEAAIATLSGMRTLRAALL
jgi:hypothetical protein